MKKLNLFLNLIIVVIIGVFISYSLYVYWHYMTYPNLYVATSFPWYTSIQIYGIVAAVGIAVALLLKLIIRRKLKG